MKFIDPIKLLSKIEFDKHGNITTTMSGLRIAMGESEVEAEPVKHGRWKGKPIAGYSTVRCSVCGEVYTENNGRWLYCPNCGAKMDIDEGEEDDTKWSN